MKVLRFTTILIGVTFVFAILATAVGFMAQMDVVVRAPGELRPCTYAEVWTPTEGRVIKRFRREGDDVKAGDPILLLESDKETMERDKVQQELTKLEHEQKDLERKKSELATRVELARAGVSQAEADLEEQAAQIKHAELGVEQALKNPLALEIRIATEKLKQQRLLEKEAGKEVEDSKMLLEKGMVAEQMHAKAVMKYQRAQSESRVLTDALELLQKNRTGIQLKNAQTMLEKQRASLKATQARLEERRQNLRLAGILLKDESNRHNLEASVEKNRLELARLNRVIEEKTIRAPIDGLLHALEAREGQTVTPKQRICYVYDISRLLFYSYPQQVDLADVAPNQPALLYIDALPYRDEGTFDATVAEVGKVARPPTNEERSYSGSMAEMNEGGAPRGLAILEVKPGDPRNDRLRVGFPGYAEIITGRASMLEVFFDMTD